MKKLLAMLLAVVMVLSLAACNSTPSETTAPTETTKAPTETTAPPPVPEHVISTATIVSTGDLSKETEAALRNALEAFTADFLKAR